MMPRIICLIAALLPFYASAPGAVAQNDPTVPVIPPIDESGGYIDAEPERTIPAQNPVEAYPPAQQAPASVDPSYNAMPAYMPPNGQPAPASLPLATPLPGAPSTPGQPVLQAPNTNSQGPVPPGSVLANPPGAAPAPVISGKDMKVQLRILNKTLAQQKILTVPMDTVLQFETLEILPKRCSMDPGAKPKPQQAALLEIYERKPNLSPERLFSGWMFADAPSLTHIEHPYYDVTVLACIPKERPKTEEAKAAPEKGKAAVVTARIPPIAIPDATPSDEAAPED